MYSFGQRSDMSIVDEPLYAHYLAKTDVDHPMKQEILDSQSTDFQEVVENVVMADYITPHVFFKQMSHHLMNENKSFLLSCENIILIREPREMINSFAKVITKPSIIDLGLLNSLEIYNYLVDQGKKPIVLDSNDLLKNPKTTLGRLCTLLSIDFEDNMLQWEAGKREEDGVWAPHWYANVHKSRGFKPYEKKEIFLEDKFQALYKSCLPIYNKLKSVSI